MPLLDPLKMPKAKVSEETFVEEDPAKFENASF